MLIIFLLMLIILWVRCSREPERKGQIHLRDQFKENVFFQSVPELLEWMRYFAGREILFSNGVMQVRDTEGAH